LPKEESHCMNCFDFHTISLFTYLLPLLQGSSYSDPVFNILLSKSSQ
jgi:hypothetical protein